jgi:hypothetical protein
MKGNIRINVSCAGHVTEPPTLTIEVVNHTYTAAQDPDPDLPYRYIFTIPSGVEPPNGYAFDWPGHHLRPDAVFPTEPGDYEGPELQYGPAPAQPRPPVTVPAEATQLVGRAWTRGGAPFYPWYWTLMWALGGWMRGERDRVEQHFRWMSDVGATGFRALCQVDWAGEAIDPDLPGYEAALGDMLDVAFDRYGLLAKLTLIGGGARDHRDLATKVRSVLATRRHKVLLLEGVNEGNGSPDQARDMLDILRDLNLPMAAGFGNAGIEAIRAASALARANVACLHTERGGSDDRKLRQVWDLKEFSPLAADDGEGPGPGASAGGQCDDAIILAAKRAGAVLGGGAGAFCAHTGAGVYGRARAAGPGREACPANIWETPQIAAIAEHVGRACEPLDLGAENWARYNTGFPVRVVEGPYEKVYGGRALGRFGQIVTACRREDGTPAPRVVFEGNGKPYWVCVPGGGLLAESQDGGRLEVGGYNAYVVQGDDQ